ncbi:hypothetical protein RclHR1_07160007 [Rhizophagus clarus]|uniref:SGNH hydrolase-type esterase domain-containing protein n=1 Tax=Rhizophagus clarus TaxID=94130 RepID=A0A2Z6SKR2_9GLOM|nr:hypothetical protein RclHR1_07160007 [Rhizophagus clarus]
MVVDGQSGDRVVDGRFKRRLLQSIKKQADKGKSFDWIVILGGTNDCFNGYKSNNIFAVLKDLYLNSENSGANVSALTISNFNNVSTCKYSDPSDKAKPYDLASQIQHTISLMVFNYSIYTFWL